LLNKGNCGEKGGLGRSSVLTKGDKLRIYNLLFKNPFISATDIVDRLHLLVTSETVRKYLISVSFSFTRRKPVHILALDEHIKLRFD